MTPALAPTADQVTDLISRARESGTVALPDLNAAFERSELMPDAIDDIMRVLEQDGIEIVDPGSDDSEDQRTVGGPERVRRAGTSDLVRIYLREIGKVPLLTAQDEVELAKAIEAGLFAQEMLSAVSEARKNSTVSEARNTGGRGAGAAGEGPTEAELGIIADDGLRARQRLNEANL